jgi:hypothetical protein
VVKQARSIVAFVADTEATVICAPSLSSPASGHDIALQPGVMVTLSSAQTDINSPPQLRGLSLRRWPEEKPVPGNFRR